MTKTMNAHDIVTYRIENTVDSEKFVPQVGSDRARLGRDFMPQGKTAQGVDRLEKALTPPHSRLWSTLSNVSIRVFSIRFRLRRDENLSLHAFV